jgi:hypothetical protein
MKITKQQLRRIVKEAIEMPYGEPAAGITDFGAALEMEDVATGEISTLPRYGVWAEAGRGKHEVVETGDDLEYLLKKYGLTIKQVTRL